MATQCPIVLVVDDDPSIVRFCQHALAGRAEVVVAGSVADAVALLAFRQVDVVVTDFNLPNETGMSLLSQVKSSFPRIRRVLMTAAVAEAVEPGLVDAVLHKPFRLAELRRVALGEFAQTGVAWRFSFQDGIAAIHWTGAPGEADLLAQQRASECFLGRGERHALLVETAPGADLPLRLQHLQAEWHRSHDESIRRTCVAMAFVFPSAATRWALRVAGVLSPFPVPMKTFSARAEAEAWLRRCLDEPDGRVVK
jgi:CheY-like chemotaxis protein